jgi:protein-lysine N-methyltransferase EEF2KMT
MSYIRDNEVGLRLWNAALILAEYCIASTKPPACNPFANKRAVELGTGIGMSGLVCAAQCSAAEVVLTDGQPRVIANLRHNVELNSELLATTSTAVSVLALDWATATVDDFGGDVGALIAADVVYDAVAIPALVRCVQLVVQHWPAAFVLFASTLRNASTFELFLSELRSADIPCVDVTADALAMIGEPIYWSQERGSVTLTQIGSAAAAVAAQ